MKISRPIMTLVFFAAALLAAPAPRAAAATNSDDPPTLDSAGQAAGQAAKSMKESRPKHAGACKDALAEYRAANNWKPAPYAGEDSETRANASDNATNRIYEAGEAAVACVVDYCKKNNLCQPELSARLDARLKLDKAFDAAYKGKKDAAAEAAYRSAASDLEGASARADACLTAQGIRLPRRFFSSDDFWPRPPYPKMGRPAVQ